jgi:hypothetical protein
MDKNVGFQQNKNNRSHVSRSKNKSRKKLILEAMMKPLK